MLLSQRAEGQACHSGTLLQSLHSGAGGRDHATSSRWQSLGYETPLRAQGCTAVIPVLWRQRQEGGKLEASLGYLWGWLAPNCR